MRVTEASHAKRLAVGAAIGPLGSSSAVDTRSAPDPGSARDRSSVMTRGSVGRPPSGRVGAERTASGTVTVTCGRSPPTTGRSVRSRNQRQISPKASARRCGAVRPSSTSSARRSASTTAPIAVSNEDPVSGSRSPSTRIMPSNVTDAWSRRADRPASAPPPDVARSRSTTWRQCAKTRRRSGSAWQRAASGLDEQGLGFVEVIGFGGACVGEHAHRGERERPNLEAPARGRHVLRLARLQHVATGCPPRDLQPGDSPGSGRQVAIAFERAAAVELGQSPEAFGFERLAGRVQLDEVGLDPRVGHVAQHLHAQLVDRRPQLAHRALPRGLAPDFDDHSTSNMCSTLRRSSRADRDARHARGEIPLVGRFPRNVVAACCGLPSRRTTPSDPPPV